MSVFIQITMEDFLICLRGRNLSYIDHQLHKSLWRFEKHVLLKKGFKISVLKNVWPHFYSNQNFCLDPELQLYENQIKMVNSSSPYLNVQYQSV